ncbi:MAG: Helix-turn-helix domain [Solirubrobacteraceae bacterium]
MTEAKAKQLGRLLAKARERQGLTTREVAESQDFTHVWVHRVEQGEFRQPTAQWLWRLAEVLKLDPARIDRLMGESLSSNIPNLHTYFRLGSNASEAEIAELEAAVQAIHQKYERRERDDHEGTTKHAA